MRIIILLTLLLSSVYSLAQPHSSQQQVSSIQAPVSHALEQLKSAGIAPEHILVVFDDDNTLETTNKFDGHNQYLGSVAWSNWQSALIKTDPTSQYAIAKNDAAFFADENYIFSMIPMTPTEPGLASFIHTIEQQGTPVIVETARSATDLNSTQAQLQKATMSFSNLEPDLSLDFTPPGGREVALQHGIMLVAGQNKGLMLQQLFAHIKALYPSFKAPQAIIFVDDTNKNDDDVYNAFVNSGITIKTFTDNHMQPYVKRFNQHDKLLTTQAWHRLARAAQRSIDGAMIPAN